MGEEISRLMDGELSDEEFERAYSRLKQADGLAAWVSFHVIGDTLRDMGQVCAGADFSQRFAARLEAEPTVLAPRAKPHSRPLAFAWAAAAGIAAVALVGWVAFGTIDADSAAMAKAGEAATLRAAAVRPRLAVPADYLLAHEEYSPSIQIQGVGPYMRAVSAPGPDGQP